MTARTRVAVIGAGAYACMYHIPHLVANPDVELAALCARNQEALAEKAARFGVPRWHTDYAALLEELSLDAVVVSSPHVLHYGHAKAALQRGLHVLVDKHVVLRTAEWRELMALAAAKDLVLMPALNRHLDPANLRAKQLITSGDLGEAYFAFSTQISYPLDRHYASLALAGGGPLVGRGAHMAALIPWLTGWQPSEVTALFTKDPGREVESSDVVNVKATGGQLFQMAIVKTGYKDVDEVQVVGTKGAVKLARPAPYQPWLLTHYGQGGVVIPESELPQGQTTTDHFIRAVRGEEALRVPPEDALPSVEIVEAAYESIKTGRTVRLR